VPQRKAVRAQAKGNIFNRIGDGIRRMIRETVGELRKVSWPTRQEATNLTWIVLVVIVIVGIYFFVIDSVLSLAINFVLGLG
jgi:preprotein translocase subunit SecE